MVDRTLHRAAAAAVAALVPAAADAATVIAIPLSALVSGSQSFTGQFNLAPLLTDPSGTSYKVTAARIASYGYSDASLNQTSAGPYGPGQLVGSYWYQNGGYYGRSCSFWSGCYYYFVPTYALASTYEQSRDVVRSDTVVDRMQVAVGSQTAIDAVDAVPTQFTGSSPAPTLYTGDYYAGTQTYLRTDHNYQEGFWGPLATSLDLDAAHLSNLNSSRLLQYLLSAPTGQYRLTNIALSFELEALPAPVSAVPEPTTWAMLLSGFGLAGGALRLQRRRSAATRVSLA